METEKNEILLTGATLRQSKFLDWGRITHEDWVLCYGRQCIDKIRNQIACSGEIYMIVWWMVVGKAAVILLF